MYYDIKIADNITAEAIRWAPTAMSSFCIDYKDTPEGLGKWNRSYRSSNIMDHGKMSSNLSHVPQVKAV